MRHRAHMRSPQDERSRASVNKPQPLSDRPRRPFIFLVGKDHEEHLRSSRSFDDAPSFFLPVKPNLHAPLVAPTHSPIRSSLQLTCLRKSFSQRPTTCRLQRLSAAAFASDASKLPLRPPRQANPASPATWKRRLPRKLPAIHLAVIAVVRAVDGRETSGRL